MKTAEADIYLDKTRPKKSGKCSVKIKITHNRKRKYFSTGIDLTIKEFEHILFGKRKTNEQKDIEEKLDYFKKKARDVIKKIPVFTFSAFEEHFLDQRNTFNSVEFAFEKYIEELKAENKLGTASSYESAIKSISTFKKNLTFAEVTPSFLKKYENWMLNKKKSKSTIGIYLRPLRAIFNLQNIDKSLYPFGEGQNKYSIPTSKNIKKALTNEELLKLYQFKTKPNSTEEMAKDYWFFLYLCNGMNIKDFCLLKWTNIEGAVISYQRAKTSKTSKESKQILVSLKDEAKAIIDKWGQKSLSKDNYIFPHLKNEMSEEVKMKTYKQLTKTVNKYIKRIAKEIGINKTVTTYYARHTFATTLKRNGNNTEFISELLGHSSIEVTNRYLDSFETEQIHKQTDVLTDILRKAN